MTHPAFDELNHRPWPLPAAPWVMSMEWHQLLFAHWPVRPAALAPLLPPGLTLQTWEGWAWLGVVPFMMRGVRARLTPALPWVGAFPELNVRTYVTAEGRPGVWFFSLDAGNPLAVRGARYGFHLPYFDAAMRCDQERGRRSTDDGRWAHDHLGGGRRSPAALAEASPSDTGLVHYHSRRTHQGARPAAFAGSYRPTGPAYRSAPGSLEHWLTERYCLYAANRRGRLWRGEIQHIPWPLQPAEAEIRYNTMGEQIGLGLADPPALLHYVDAIIVAGWWEVPVGAR